MTARQNARLRSVLTSLSRDASARPPATRWFEFLARGGNHHVTWAMTVLTPLSVPRALPDANDCRQGVFCTDGGGVVYVDRAYDCVPAWRGEEFRLDNWGRLWKREFESVTNDFGDLVEVLQ